MGRPVRVWAWAEGVANFGDELGPAILTRLGYEVTRVALIGDADVLASGSLLEHAAAAARPGTIVWGSGLMHGRPVDVSRLDVRVVRGRLTAQALGLDVATGDPGCLVPWFWRRPKIRHGLGVVRHYADMGTYPWADVTIDASQPVDEVIEFIGSCGQIASSSLHGLIVAQAWGIPALRLPCDAVAGGDFKWVDWLCGGQHAAHLLEALP